MDIDELSRRSGIPKPTIYRYIRAGLLQRPAKRGFRGSLFNEEHLLTLRKIVQLREEGALSLREILELVDIDRANKDRAPDEALQSKKEQIMDKAISLFSRRGFAETKVSDITDALGVAKGTFYLYFRSKKDLFLECIGRLTMIMIPGELWEGVRKERDFVERQRMKLRQFLLSFPTFSGILNLLRLSFQSDDPGLAGKARDTYKLLAGPLIKDLSRAMANKEAREVNAEVVSLLLLGMAESLGYLTMMDARYSKEEGAEILLDLMRRGLLLPKPEKPGEPATRWTVTDEKGVAVLLEDIRIGGEAYLAGTLGEGEVCAPLQNILGFTMQGAGQTCCVTVTISAGEEITLAVDGTTPVSGKSCFGVYTIPLEKVSSLSLDDPRKA